ncbi:LPP20 family lipoprotein [Parathalassolituus penaei]|uniref:LPP20 family lipoprotein n=1 Tax=Parathalassolituus penaei TaxID=2997323 RepID=A0A9X3EFD1_9GAMM|nr:LPP20 family lipoprotein [Parathalassolituus penaei]MCY0966225.1 LPP20 family lipoprotein [Parathalassolituus penaei]
MRKHLITATLLSLLAACSSSPDKEAKYEKECVFADGSGDEAPLWVCGAPLDGVELSAVGYSDKSNAGPNFMKQMAATAARVELAQMMKIQVQNMIKQYAETTGVSDSETVDKVNSVTTKQITNESLSGTRIYRQMLTPTGGMVVAVGIDPATAEALVKQALRTSMNNEQALWQKFQSKKSFDELAEEIARSKE